MATVDSQGSKQLAISLILSLVILVAGLGMSFSKGLEANKKARELNTAVAVLDELEEAEPGHDHSHMEDRP